MQIGFATKPDLGWSWAVLVASFGAHFIHGFFLTAVSLLQLSLLEHFREDVFKTSWALSIFLGLFSISGPLASFLINKWSCRVCMITGGLIVSISHVLTAFMPNITGVIFSLGVFGGLGSGLCYTSSVVAIGLNFEKKRNFASGMAVSGAGIGTLSLAPLMQTVSDFYGYFGLWLTCSGLALQYCVFGAMFFPSRLELERKIKTQLLPLDKDTGKEGLFDKINNCRNSFSVFYQKELVSLNLSMFLCNIGIYLVHLHFAGYVISVGFSKLDAALLLSICGICNCIARILVGSAANSSNIDEFVMYGGTFSLTGLTTALFPFYGHTFGGQVFYMVTFGCYSGCCYSLLNSICIILAGVSNLATVYGLLMLFTGIGCFIGPLMGGFIVNSGGTYGLAISIAGILILLGSLFAWGSGAGKRSESQKKDTEEINIYNKELEEGLEMIQSPNGTGTERLMSYNDN